MRSVALALLVLLLVLCLTTSALSAEPTLLPDGILEGGDLRSEGEGPGVAGSPLLILAAVVALGVATAAITLVAARLGRRD